MENRILVDRGVSGGSKKKGARKGKKKKKKGFVTWIVSGLLA